MTYFYSALLWIASYAACAGVGIHVLPLAPSGYDDCEAVTNVVFDVGAVTGQIFRVELDLMADACNNYTVAFGQDVNGDGVLDLSEDGLRFGWDCGAWFYRACEIVMSDRVVRNSGRKTLAFEIRFGSQRRPYQLTVMENSGIVFSGQIPDDFLNSNWNLVRITSRGLYSPAAEIHANILRTGLAIRLR